MIKADTAGIGNLARRLQAVAQDAPRVFAQAASSVARASKTEAKREITAVYGLPQKRVDEGLAARAVGTDIITTASAKGVTLQSFGGRQTKRGYSAAVLRGRRQVIRKGFTPAKFGGVPFKRVGTERLPIKVLYGPSVAAMLRNREISERFVVRQAIRAREELTRRIFRELDQR